MMKNKITVKADLKEFKNILSALGKKEQRKLIIEMMKEDEKSGMYNNQ